jgi:2',3'-cyclic-nucleotide 2'-phosphodiesterase (5'-nucleotidase family)
VINQERALGGPVLVLDAGDGLVGDRDPARRTQGETSVAALNLLGYDAMVLGAQDLALGLEVLRRRLAEAEFAMLSANAVASSSGELIATPYVVRQIDGHAVAIVGLSGQGGTTEITLLDPLETARAVVADVTTRADVIILLSHAGVLVDQQISQAVPGIDLIISGGEMQVETPWWGEQTGTLILHADVSSPGHAGRRMGIARLGFDENGRLVSQSWEQLTLGPEVVDDPAVSEWVARQR